MKKKLTKIKLAQGNEGEGVIGYSPEYATTPFLKRELSKNPNYEKWSSTDTQIKIELSRLLSSANADINIMAAVNSWKETISDDDVLKMLKASKTLNTFYDGRENSPEI